ncbi:AAA domain protein (macronuclear) [Tetrahymena thermophila SB210]|uniref:AAA domain protein n=1 Tax=Tetrahymena thermophila (strain SB210) TaxID=312017 RepID=I7MI99_TETTS|nr:AAA domain protein [Tetrahymena thermophila SB210]EAR91027.2 AAA domain protein [Tetrahymena thermophila SB210]|eukprot:XP_001011272.2 AAA domain protein [Tetrahymena thermophila SB210]
MKGNQQNRHLVWQKVSEIKGFQVLCLDCRVFFDNQRNPNNSNNSSSIVSHLIQSKHNKVQLLINSGIAVQKHIVCSSCKLGDVFKLQIYDYPQGILLLCNECSFKFINQTKFKQDSEVKHSTVIQQNEINSILFDAKRVQLNPDILQINQNKKSKVQYIRKVDVVEANAGPQNISQAQQQKSTNNLNQNPQLIGSDKIQNKNQNASQEQKIEKLLKIQCLDCKQYFDNQKINGSLKTSIIKHLTKQNHNRITCILNQNQQKNITPDCYKCKKRNVFDLTICKVNNEQYLLCSQCLNKSNGSLFTNDPNIAMKLVSTFPNEPLITNYSINSTFLDQLTKSDQPKQIQSDQTQLNQQSIPQNIQIGLNNNNNQLLVSNNSNNEDTQVKCLQCNNIFQNQRNKHDSVTQIVKHLKKCSHNKIEIQEKARKTSFSTFKCLSCNQNNIFVLFIVEIESFYFVLCNQCINSKMIQFQGKDSQSIEKCKKSAIVQNGSINTLLMNLTIKKKEYYPVNNEHKNQPDQNQIEQDNNDDDYDFCLNGGNDNQVQVGMLNDPKTQNINNQDRNFDQSRNLQSIQVNSREEKKIEIFKNVEAYQHFFKKILNQEQYEISKQIQQSVLTTKALILSENQLQIQVSSNHLLKQGKELKIKWGNFKSKFYVESIDDHKIVIKIQDSNKSLSRFKVGNVVENVQIKLINPKQIFERILQGINKFSSLEESLQKKILGQFEKDDKSIKSDDSLEIIDEQAQQDIAQLNQSQLQAIQSSLSKNISLIQGPPGTGKTETAAQLVLEIWYKINKNQQNEKILVCAPSNLAADNISDRIHAQNREIKVIRIVSQARQRVKVSYQFQDIVLHKVLKKEGFFNKNSVLKRAKQLIENADVICTTCINSVDKFIKGISFSTVVIDEANQAIEPETIIPLQHQAKKLILIGDHKQLPPIILSIQASKDGLKRSLFSRLVQAGLIPQFLSIQYRMHPEIRKLASSIFYQNQLKDGVNEQDRTPTPKFNWLNNKIPIQFYDVQGQEITLQDGKSFINEEEAKLVKSLVSQLIQAGVKDNDIGIITPYLSQSNYISQLIKNSNILIDTTYSFQGQERDYIIISCVRINNFQNLGILRTPQLINVSITRAKRGLLIVGNKKHVSYSRWWKQIIDYLDKLKLIQEIKKEPIENIYSIENNKIINKIDERLCFHKKS